MKTVDLIFEDGAWWVFDGENPVHSFDLDEDRGIGSRKAQEKALGWIWNMGWKIGLIENPNRAMETFEPPQTISIKDWDDVEHWFVADLFADGEIGDLIQEFPNEDEAEDWRIQFCA